MRTRIAPSLTTPSDRTLSASVAGRMLLPDLRPSVARCLDAICRLVDGRHHSCFLQWRHRNPCLKRRRSKSRNAGLSDLDKCITGPQPLLEKVGRGSHVLRTPERTLPDDGNAPSLLDEQLAHLEIASHVRLKLGLPELRSSGRRCGEPTVFVTMPETAVDKDDRTVSPQHQIRAPGHVCGVKSVSKTPSMQRLAKRQLRLRILAPDSRHHSRAGLAVHHIIHAAWPSSPTLLYTG